MANGAGSAGSVEGGRGSVAGGEAAAVPTPTPDYSEAQARTWLGWLARGMQRQGLTVFQIESLQPTWLDPGWSTYVYLLTTRLLWGLLGGTGFGLTVALGTGLMNEFRTGIQGYLPEFPDSEFGTRMLMTLVSTLIVGWKIGIPAGLLGGLAELMPPSDEGKKMGRVTSFSKRPFVHNSVVVGVVGAVFGWWRGGMFGWLIGALAGAFIGGPIWTERHTERRRDSDIRPVESVAWSWRSARRTGLRRVAIGLMVGLGGGLVAGLGLGLLGAIGFAVEYLAQAVLTLGSPGPTSGLVDNLEDALKFGLAFALDFGLTAGLMGGIIAGVIAGLRPGVQELKTRPNQGIWLSTRTALQVGSISGLVVGLPLAALGGIGVGLVYGVLVGLCFGLWLGGLDVLQHGILRLLLTLKGHAPLNYARFLDYAAEELSFLQKVGGGYVFIHRYLLEYFAGVEEAGIPTAD